MGPPERAYSEPGLLPAIATRSGDGGGGSRPSKLPLRSLVRGSDSNASLKQPPAPGPCSFSALPSTSNASAAQEHLERLPSVQATSETGVQAAESARASPRAERRPPSKALASAARNKKKLASRAASSPAVGTAAAGSKVATTSRPRLWYVAQFGNNSPLLRQIMRRRPGWAAGPGDPSNLAGKTSYEQRRVQVPVFEDTPEIQFLWTQFKERQFFDVMLEQRPGVCITLNEEYKMEMKQKNRTESVPSAIPRAHNHFEGNGALCTKSGLCESMATFFLGRGRDPFGAVPLTFVIRKGSQDEEFAQFREAYKSIEASSGQRVWLVKPGEWANRGHGILIFDTLEEVEERVNSKEKLWVVQKYMERPMLIHRRKFDLRTYCLVTQEPNGGAFHAFHYNEAYLRLISGEFTLESLHRDAHLSNGNVQAKTEDYGKLIKDNRLTLPEFQRYINEHHSHSGVSVQDHIVPQIESLVADAIHAVADRLNPRQVDHCFEIFGCDFMIDANFRVWLIEVNTNPCLETDIQVMSRLVPKMLDEALQLSLDRIFSDAAPASNGSGAASKSCRSSEGASGWKEIWTSRDTDELRSQWVPSLPQDAEVVVPSLGRDILGITK